MNVRLMAALLLLAAETNSWAAVPPSILVPPLSQAAMAGSDVTLAVTASGTAPLQYQWAMDGRDLVERTNATLGLVSVTLADAGDYSVVIANVAGAITSRVARLELVNGFMRATNAALGRSGQPLGAAWGDFNNDGAVDLFIASSTYLLYTNRGDGTFQQLTNPILAGERSGGRAGASWADFDNDGQLDLAIAGNAGAAIYLYRNLGDGTNFARVTSSLFDGSGQQIFTPAWGDYDNDGWVDLFVATSGGNGNDLLFHNLGGNSFARTTNSILTRDGAATQSGIWGDFDGDGDLDLYSTEPNAARNPLYRNDGNGTFLLVTNAPIGTDPGNLAGGCVWGDFDNDGDLDLFVTSFSNNAYLYRNDGNGEFTKITNSIVVQDGPSAGCTALDFDNDGWLDLVSPGPRNLLYHNNRDGSFTKVTTGDVVAQPVVSWGNNSFAVADVNRDGFEDLLWADFNGNSQLFYNNGSPHSWLTLHCEGRLSNRAGIGTKVRVRTVSFGREMWQLRELSGGGVVFAQNELAAHFGLGDAVSADVVRLEWPSGIVQTFRDVIARQFLTIIEPDARITPATQSVQAGDAAFFTVTTTLPPPLRYQWHLGGALLPGATNATYSLGHVQAQDAGVYSVEIDVPATGAHVSLPSVFLGGPLQWLQQPASMNVRPGSNAVFTVRTSGIGPVAYQWRFNFAAIADATNSMLVLTNCQFGNGGIYDVVAANSFGSVTSAPAVLGLLSNPVITVPPVSQSVCVGGSVTFSVVVTGSPAPFTFEWRRGVAGLLTNVQTEPVSFFTLTNIQTNQAGNYRVVVKNPANFQPGIISGNAVLTVLADGDGDGLPDDWEQAHDLAMTNAVDALLDSDGDGVSNRDEYLAGTEPRDAGSRLQFDGLDVIDGTTAVLRFLARSNKTYTLQSRSLGEGEAWRRVADVPAAATNRPVVLIDSAPAGEASQRSYRLVTPRVP